MKRLMLIILLLGSPAVWAADETVIIDVEAMTCPLCVTVVNKVLRQTDGVIKAKSSLKTRQAVVVVPEGFDTNKLLQAIDKTGYKGVIHQVEKSS
ncbi:MULTISPECIES: heavy-metal-associated domain-containing protein [Shewanella]|jgi:mercuric ion binding protein|uniref:Mercuric ion binding protein n=1 Tax=Shewanella fodinae TaxID=552357 RepID=A0A4R2F5G3_9GAMM|nr:MULTISPECIES: heavy metal-associated domain-containing protein [Shewanella]MDN5370181.1 periplasmic mercuric ion binding protein [Shewanella sp.]MBO1272010.1 heavy-metal-associated domain-containing protein [Shewanella sp. 4t3-1-2LB]MCL2905996.1 heavy-metal-associated domain-containing protein [Shewanella fodinae]TCN81287.1 mercuric ion binding protein [Shewanella fodinae]GGY95703.1 heavy metal transporter [Shewanella fodinae]